MICPTRRKTAIEDAYYNIDQGFTLQFPLLLAPLTPDGVGNMATVYLVSCVSQKRLVPTMAKELYISPWFKKARRYAESTGCPWFIMSAEHGLVRPDQVLSPYEKTLNTMPIAERRKWAERVSAQLEDVSPQMERAVFLAGHQYREFLTSHLQNCDIIVEVPMQGLRIGEQLSWLGNHNG